MPSRSKWGARALVVLLLSLTSAAQAAPRNEAVANAHIGGVCCNPFDFTLGVDPLDTNFDLERDTGVMDPALASASVISQVIDSTRPSGWLFRRQSAAKAEARAGVLKAEAIAGYFADGFRTFESVTARAVASFEDVLRINGSGLGSIDVSVAFRVSGALSGAPSTSFALGVLSVQGSQVIDFRNSDAGSTGAYTCTSSAGAATCQGEVTLRLPVNTDLSISGHLGVVASAVGSPGRDNASALYSRTAFAHLTLLTPGFELVSQSGHDYASPVPEPSAWGAMLAGLAVIALAVSRRRTL